MPEPTPIPCRIFGVPAPAAPVVALLRRGPTSRVQLLLWQTETDTFVDGQWLHGHVYERRCSLSPDGQLFVYFVSKYGIRNSESTETWTAISRPPYFTALALWPKGDAWNGGGVFHDNRTLLLNHPADSQPLVAPAHRLSVMQGRAIPWFAMGEDFPIYEAILQQQGWQRVEQSPYAETVEQVREQLPVFLKERGRYRSLNTAPLIWQKSVAGGRFVLQQANYGADFNQTGSYHVMRWKLIDRTTKQAQPIEQAEWADWDQRGRLVFTRQGQVWASLPERYPQEAASLIDLNDRRPAAVPPPDWAREWP